MFSSETLRHVQNTLDSAQSHNRRLETNKLWREREARSKKRKKRKRNYSSHISSDEKDINWITQQKYRKMNAKKRKIAKHFNSIFDDKWDHDKYEQKYGKISQEEKLYNALLSLKYNKSSENDSLNDEIVSTESEIEIKNSKKHSNKKRKKLKRNKQKKSSKKPKKEKKID